jgi:multiple sugar transport system ATP-binding protein
MASVHLEAVRKVYGKVVAVDGVDLEIAEHEFVVLLGPSGCGKTTLLRCLAGLERVDSGRVLIGGRDATAMPPRARRISMVFQSYAVFPHMSVAGNIGFGLRMQKEPRAQIRERVESVAGLLGINELLDRYPSQLSGGQRQRVAVARALAAKADVLLMDEPLSNLDALLRMQMRAELKALLQRLGTTCIYVTHDQVEALSMGDRVAVMNAGRIAQVAPPLEVYDDPANTYVGGFIGTPPMNFLPAEVSLDEHELLARLSGGQLRLSGQHAAKPPSEQLLLGIRAESISVRLAPGPNLIAGNVLVTEPLGSHNLITVRAGHDTVKVSARPDVLLPPGQAVWLEFDPTRIRWMDRDSGTAVPADTPHQANPDPALPQGGR